MRRNEISVDVPAVTEPEGPLRVRQLGGRTYLRQDAAAELRRSILGANLPPGARLPSERELSDQLGVSRISVREALRLLEQEGLVEVHQGRPAVVRPFDLTPLLQPLLRRLSAERDVIRDLLAVRAPLEVLAARSAAERRSQDDVDAMRACLDLMRELVDRGQNTLVEDLRFHDLLYQASRNPVIVLFAGTIKGLLRDVRETASHAGASPALSWRQHSEIFDAVESRHATRAAEVMQLHMDTVLAEQEHALDLLATVTQPTQPAGPLAEDARSTRASRRKATPALQSHGANRKATAS